MRTFAILMLLLNLAYFGWHIGFDSGGQSESIMIRSPAQQAPERLQLLRELEVSTQEPESTIFQYCYWVGVFNTALGSEIFASEINQLGYTTRIQSAQVEGRPDYWVHMPPFISEATALQRLEELKAKNINSFLIDSGELAQGISLGLFSIEEFARAVQAELAAQGYPSSILEIPRIYTGFWINIEGLPEEGFPDFRWSQFLEKRPGLQKVEKLCETIAPEP